MKKRVKKIMLAAAILLILFIIIEVIQFKQNHFNVDKETFAPRSSLDEVLKEQYKKIEGLAAADKYHITTESNKKINVPNMRRSITFDKVWLNYGGVYILYSITIRQDDKNLAAIPKMTFDKVILNMDDGKRVDACRSKSS